MSLHFDLLLNRINDLDSLKQWTGFRSGDTNFQELAYIVKTSSVFILQNPYSILNDYSHFFAYREPYVIEISYMNNHFFIIYYCFIFARLVLLYCTLLLNEMSGV